MTYFTVHKAKGTEADYIILLDGGPPKAGQADEAWAIERAFRVFRGEDTAEEEERRIWYVALTAAAFLRTLPGGRDIPGRTRSHRSWSSLVCSTGLCQSQSWYVAVSIFAMGSSLCRGGLPGQQPTRLFMGSPYFLSP